MSGNTILKKASETIAEAIELDSAGDYEKAYMKYQRALEQFIVAIKYERNEATKKILTKKVEEYMARAEALKASIKEGKSKAVAQGGSGGGQGGSNELDKLAAGLEEAIVSEKPNIKWSDVAGLEMAKEALKEAVILPVKFPQLFSGKRKPWKGILLYGPPGTGKSYLAKAVATEANSTFFSVASADLVSKWQGESEKLVKSLFNLARSKAPAIIFIDEIDSLCGARGEGENEASRKIKTQFLVAMDGVGPGSSGSDPKRVLVLGATNLPWIIDGAMKRRFEKRIYIPLPDEGARKVMFKLNIGDTPNDLNEADFSKLGRESEGYSGADVNVVVREALMMPLRELQDARFFRENSEGYYEPILDYPPCPFCPMKLSKGKSSKGEQCKRCHAVRMNLYEVPPEKIKDPKVRGEHFYEALHKTKASVGKDDLKQFVQWTKEFGQDGSKA
eukprot:maker-scaffold_3-augustus-gene-12.9-mRNA-1 protein AED:0.08 eAED:0.08 QI:89/1/1/1/0.5/0.33/3/552/446